MDYGKQEVAIYKKENSNISQQLIPIEKTEPLQKEIETFVNCVIQKKPPPVSGEEARKSLKVALEIQKKIWRRKF
jgi:predicted dehydrogenase